MTIVIPNKSHYKGKDAYMVKGLKASQSIKLNLPSSKFPDSKVSVVGRHARLTYQDGKEDNLPYMVTLNLMRRILKKHYGIDVTSDETPMNDLFPVVHRMHHTDITVAMALRQDGFFGIEFIFEYDGPISNTTGGFDKAKNKKQLLGGGIIRRDDAVNTLGDISGVTKHYFPKTLRQFTHDACNVLVGCSGNINARSTSTILSTGWDNYRANTFYFLQEGVNRAFNQPEVLDANTITYFNENLEMKYMSLYGYRIIESETYNISISTTNQTEYAYKFSKIHKLDKLNVVANEFSTTRVQNDTKAEGGGTDMHDQDINPVNGKVFYFKTTPEIDHDYTFKYIHFPGSNRIGADVDTTTVPDEDIRIEPILHDANDNYYSNIDKVIETNGWDQYQIFSSADEYGFVWPWGQGGGDPVKFSRVPHPQVFKYCKYSNVYIQPGQEISIPIEYKFVGSIKNFYKTADFEGIMRNGFGMEKTNIQSRRDMHQNKCFIAMIERSKDITGLEPAPDLEIRTDIKRNTHFFNSKPDGFKKLFYNKVYHEAP